MNSRIPGNAPNNYPQQTGIPIDKTNPNNQNGIPINYQNQGQQNMPQYSQPPQQFHNTHYVHGYMSHVAQQPNPNMNYQQQGQNMGYPPQQYQNMGYPQPGQNMGYPPQPNPNMTYQQQGQNMGYPPQQYQIIPTNFSSQIPPQFNQPPYGQQQCYPPTQGYPPLKQNNNNNHIPYQPNPNQSPPNPSVRRQDTRRGSSPLRGSVSQKELIKQVVRREADIIFDKYDRNLSGFLDTREIYPALCHIFTIAKIKNPPTEKQALEIMKGFDADENGLLDKQEFQNLLLILCDLDMN